MTPFEAYKEYTALKNHFTKTTYDYIKYRGKSRINEGSFDKRKDKIFFQKLAKHDDVHNFLLANFSKNPKLWIRDLAYDEQAEKVYKDWLKKTNSITQIFKNEISKLTTNSDKSNYFQIVDCISIAAHEHPKLLQLYLGNKISLEFLCIMLKITGSKKEWDEKLEFDPIWQEVKFLVEKYTPFVKYDKEKIKKIVLDYINE